MALPPDLVRKQSAPRLEPRSRFAFADCGKRKPELNQPQSITLPTVTQFGSYQKHTTPVAIEDVTGKASCAAYLPKMLSSDAHLANRPCSRSVTACASGPVAAQLLNDVRTHQI